MAVLCNGDTERIEAGRPAPSTSKSSSARTKEGQLVCILPRDAAPEEEFRISPPDWSFALTIWFAFSRTIRPVPRTDEAGSLVSLNDLTFHPLPALQTIAKLTVQRSRGDRLPVTLSAKMNELGLLRVACVSADPQVKQSWPLEFNLRPHESGGRQGTRGSRGSRRRGFPAGCRSRAHQFIVLPALEQARQTERN